MQTATEEKTAAAAAPNAPFRHEHQDFVYMGQQWDIAKMIADIDSGTLRPASDVIERAFIEGYATQMLAQDKARGPDGKTVSLFMHVDAKAAVALPPSALEEPIIFLHAGKGKGILRTVGSETPDHILGDGQHRVTKAFHEDVTSLPAYVLTAAQSRKYKI